MTIELVTGHAGSAHVSAEDVGWFNIGIVGDSNFVLYTGNKLAAAVASSNTVNIGIGDALFEGRHVRVSAPEAVHIDNGAQGVNRNDIICIKYELAGGIETASLAVVKGTATSGTPTDPTIPSGTITAHAATAYMPLWRIPISGVTPGTPVQLFKLVKSLNEISSSLWSVSQIPSLPASKITSGTFDLARIPTITSDKIQSVSGSQITGALNQAQIPNLDASQIESGVFPVARGGTGKTYGYTWQQLKNWTGAASQTWNKGSYSEYLIMAGHGTDYTGSVILPASHIGSTARDVYLTGSYNGSGVLGRAFAVTISSTTAKASIANVDGADVSAGTTWWIYGR